MPPPIEVPTARTYSATVVDAIDLTPRMRRVTLSIDDVADFAPWPGQDVVLHLLDDEGVAVRRRYTVRHLDREPRRFDLDFVLHGHGPGARWAQHATPGTSIEIFGPRGKVPLAASAWQLFVGDESALPAIAEMAEALPERVNATALVEVRDPGEEQPIEPAAELDLRWSHRGDTPAGHADVLDTAIEAVAPPASDRHVYLFGESRAVRRWRDLVLARGVGAGEISAKGYWNVGRGRG